MRTVLGLGFGVLAVSPGACSTQVMGGGARAEAGGNATSGGGTPIATGGGPTGLTGGGGTTGTGGSETSTGGSETGTGGSQRRRTARSRPPQARIAPATGAAPCSPSRSPPPLGDTDRNGTPDHANGWKELRLQRRRPDHELPRNQCQQVHNHCRPAAGASPATAYPDGHNGIDNSFGENILPILVAIQSNPGAGELLIAPARGACSSISKRSAAVTNTTR